MNSNEFISRYGSHLNKQQLQAVETVEGPVLLLAVPGSGKTTVLVTRVGYMILCRDIPAENILVLTYTIAATKDMGQRFASIFGDEQASQVEFRTINGICAKVIQEYGRRIGREPFELLSDEKETSKIISDILVNLLTEYPTESDVRVMKTWITYCKNMMLKDDEIAEIGEKEDIPLLEVFRQYNQYLKSVRQMDYDDQMIYAYQMLLKNYDLLEYYRKRFQYICVDEAQDTSKIQHAIIALLAGVNGNLFMVGDEDQSIYGFRAAYPEALLEFEQTHSKAKVLVMSQNYRSNAKIVDLADRFIQSNSYRHKKNMQAIRPEGNDIRYIELKSRNNQYNYLLKAAQNKSHETAVLYRLNECCLPLIDLLERNNIPYRLKGLEMTFFTHRVVQDVINIMRFAANPYNTDLFMKIYYKIQTFLRKNQAETICHISASRNITVFEAVRFASGISGMVIGKCNAVKTHLSNMLRETPDKAIYRIVNYLGYGDYMDRNGMDRNKLYILTNLSYREKTLESFENRIGFLYGRLKNMMPNYEANFILSTIHSAKGLEFEEVYLMDVCDGVFPSDVSLINSPKTQTEEKGGEEERRLFYVGMTRAKDRLNIFTYESEESVFVNELRKAERTDNGKIEIMSHAERSIRMISENTGNEDTQHTLRCGDRVHQILFGDGIIVEVGLDQNGLVKNFTVCFDSGEWKDFVYPTAFKKGMSFLQDDKREKEPLRGMESTESKNIQEKFEPVKENKTKETVENETLVLQANILFGKLRELRIELAKEEKLPAYCIFPDKVLVRMAEVQPVSKTQMLGISGVGEVKYAKYGERFLREIKEFKNGQKSSPEQSEEKKKSIQSEIIVKKAGSNETVKETKQSSKASTGASVKRKIETYTMNGETYRLIRGNWVNSKNTRVTKDEMYRLNAMRIKELDFEDTDVEVLINMAQEMKDSEDFIFSKKLFEAIFDKSSNKQVIRSILPRYTSILRELQQPREAIDITEKIFSVYGKSIYSPALFTSLAGAYCDIGDTKEARKKANVAMAMSGKNASIELISVYARIKAMEK